MKLGQLIECADCGEVDAPNVQGRCATCASQQVRWIVGEQSFLLASDFPREESQGLCGIDKEFLREMGILA